MKIALVVYRIGPSHGSILQTFALYQILCRMGHDVTILNRQNNPSIYRYLRNTIARIKDIVLYQDLFTKVYNVSISKKPYTALCVDIFSEEETENGITVTKYINSEGLSGKYSIYLEVDGKLYNSGEYVMF